MTVRMNTGEPTVPCMAHKQLDGISRGGVVGYAGLGFIFSYPFNCRSDNAAHLMPVFPCLRL